MRTTSTDKAANGFRNTRIRRLNPDGFTNRYSLCWSVNEKCWGPCAGIWIYRDDSAFHRRAAKCFLHAWMSGLLQTFQHVLLCARMSSLTQNWHLMILMLVHHVPSRIEFRCLKRRKHVPRVDNKAVTQRFSSPPWRKLCSKKLGRSDW